MSSIPRNEYTKWFDYDKIGTFPVFRTRQPGDYMRLFSDMKTKKIARIMLDGKVPAGIRDKIVLPFFGKEALWIPGLRMGDSCKVGPETTRILEIHWNSDNDS
jgi:tRNA(Ile)-lysidine synthase